jgi:hypothetical protein
MKTCTKCETDKPLSAFYWHKQRKHYMASCKTCNSAACVQYQRKTRVREDVPFIMSSRAAEIRRRCKANGAPVEDDLGRYLASLWLAQEGRCFYTGRPMTLTGYLTRPNAFTVDRKRPALGYVRGNLVLCCAVVNRVKQDLTIKELLRLCSEITNRLNPQGKGR